MYCARTTISAISAGRGAWIAWSTLTFSLRTSSAVKLAGGSIATWRQQLQHVVLDHVAERPGLVVEAGAGPDPDVLGGGDLDVVDVVAVPERLEHAVGETERQQVLDRLLAQVVVDPEDLALLEHVEHLAVEFERLLQGGAEGLLDDHPHLRVGVGGEAVLPESGDDQREEVGGGRQVEGAVERFSGLAVELGEHLLELGVDGLLVEFAGDVFDVLEEAPQHVLVGRAPREAADRLLALLAVVLVRFVFARDADEVEALGQRALVREVVERGQQFALGEVAGGAEEHERRRRDGQALSPSTSGFSGGWVSIAALIERSFAA